MIFSQKLRADASVCDFELIKETSLVLEIYALGRAPSEKVM